MIDVNDRRTYDMEDLLTDINLLSQYGWDVDRAINDISMPVVRERFNIVAVVDAAGGTGRWHEEIEDGYYALFDEFGQPLDAKELPSTENDGAENHLNHS